MTQQTPRVSIGMPVRNGQKYIREAIDSILAQTFTDWELIVCDNASTDATEQIVRDYVARDPRIRYHRNPADIGPAANHNLGVELSRGEYFRWHAHDDMIAPRYLEECVKALDADPSIVCVYPRTTIIDDRGAFLENYDFQLKTDSPEPSKRFAQLVLVKHRRHRAVEIFGLMRASALRQTPLEGSYARGDSVLIVRMALLGPYVELEPRLFLSRSHPSQSMQQLPSRLKDDRGRPLFSSVLGTGPLPPPEWWDAKLKGKITFPEWRLMREYFFAVADSKLPAVEKAKCYGIMCGWTVLNIPKLARDCIVALEQFLSPVMDRLRPEPDEMKPAKTT
jgi:glycosyltransferase involved in cell wall biosynthesis